MLGKVTSSTRRAHSSTCPLHVASGAPVDVLSPELASLGAVVLVEDVEVLVSEPSLPPGDVGTEPPHASETMNAAAQRRIDDDRIPSWSEARALALRSCAVSRARGAQVCDTHAPTTRSRDNVMRAAETGLEHDDDTWQRWLVDNCLGALWVVDEDACIVEVNAAAVRDLGIPRERLIGLPIAELDIDRSAVAAIRASAPGRTLWRTVSLRRSEGPPLRTTLRVDRAPTRNGWRTLLLAEPAGVVPNAPAEVQTRFVQLSNVVDAVYWLLDLNENRVLYASDAYERVWGQSREELYRDSRAWTKPLHPDDRAAVVAAMDAAASEPGSFDVRYRLMRPDGEMLWIRDRAFPMVDADGVTRRIAGIATDITTEVRSEEAARSHARQIRDVLDAVNAQVWYLDTDARVVLNNRFAGELARRRFSDTRGVTVMDLAPFWDEPERRHEESLTAIRTGVSLLGSIESWTIDGRTSWASVDKVPTFDEHGKVNGLLVFIYDITALKRAEEQLRASTIQLEQANAELESFSYSVSHDLRAPLRSIDGFSRAVLDDCGDRLDARGRDHLERVRAATKRMGSLIDALLELSRVTRAELRREPIDVTELARQVTAELDRRCPERKIEWSIAAGMTARADLRLIAIVLENVIGNAHKFTRDVAVAKIEMTCERRNGNTWFVVRDNGVGFEAGFARQLFTPFARLHPRQDFPGSGIGLATVRRIVGRHGGEVEAFGAPGAGAKFSFTLEPTQPSRGE
ncbi:MAG TPA: PAS domain S-box protein [Nannocystaceae bacterium]|nr:PAS domain S-box protein [Nannocystaceae bacterium]